MNKTVRNLARQADELARAMEPDLREIVRYNRIRDEKFAELIVKECMRMCDVADMSLLEHNCVKEASGTQSAKDFIKEHFGVEE